MTTIVFLYTSSVNPSLLEEIREHKIIYLLCVDDERSRHHCKYNQSGVTVTEFPVFAVRLQGSLTPTIYSLSERKVVYQIADEIHQELTSSRNRNLGDKGGEEIISDSGSDSESESDENSRTRNERMKKNIKKLNRYLNKDD